ncbi:MAG: PadR family transcriptional regulator [Firmicutes bacterium]|nr:PadR family transcriptional regulator [Bacillota bacterium]
MSLKHGILGLLNYGEMTGYELDKSFKRSINMFWQAQTSQIYRELISMEKLNWVETEVVIQHGKPNKKNYRITELGKSELMTWLYKDKSKEFFKSRNSFLLMLFLSGEKTVDENIEMLKRFKHYCLEYFSVFDTVDESVEYYGKMLDGDKKRVYWDIVINLGKINKVKTLEWIDDSIVKLEGLK